MSTVVQDDFVSVTQAAKLLGCTGGRIRQLLATGDLPGEKMTPWFWLIPRKAVIKMAKIPQKTGRPRRGKK